jgi:hypothetical protein
MKALSMKYFTDITTDDMKEDFRSAMILLSKLYLSKLHSSADQAHVNLSTHIDQVLSNDSWKPSDKVLGAKLYCNAGAALRAAKVKSEMHNTSTELSFALNGLYQLQSITREQAATEELPFEDVVGQKKVSLIYPSRDFFDVVCKYVFAIQSVLQNEMFIRYGTGVLAPACSYVD